MIAPSWPVAPVIRIIMFVLVGKCQVVAMAIALFVDVKVRSQTERVVSKSMVVVIKTRVLWLFCDVAYRVGSLTIVDLPMI